MVHSFQNVAELSGYSDEFTEIEAIKIEKSNFLHCSIKHNTMKQYLTLVTHSVYAHKEIRK
jgi:hypothetical protein